MIFILQIVFTVLAWRSGWRGWSLIPMGIMMAIGAFIGITIGPIETGENLLFVSTLIGDLISLVILIRMWWIPPASEQPPPGLSV